MARTRIALLGVALGFALIAPALVLAGPGTPPATPRNMLALDSNLPPGTSVLVAPPGGLAPAIPPPNDYFSQALAIASIPYANSENVREATTQPEDPLQRNGGCPTNGAQNYNSVWYSYTAPNTTGVTAFTFGSDYDTVLSVHTGTWPNLAMVVCNDDYNHPSNLQSLVTFTPTVGTTYFLDVTSYSRLFVTSTVGSLVFELHSAVPPPNDDFNNATVINSMPYTNSEDTFAATRAGDDPTPPCGATLGYNTVWYRYAPGLAGTLIVDTFGSNYDTVLAVWTGTRPYLTNVACNDDQSGQQSQVQLPVTSGVTYYIEAASKSSIAGRLLVLNARETVSVWQPRADLPLPRDRLALASDGSYVFALGGERYFTAGPRAYEPTAVVSRYDPVANSWTDVQPMPTALQDHRAVYLGGKIYIPAGFAGSGPPFYGTHLVYTIATNSWSTAAPAPWPNGRPPVFYGLAADGQGYYLTGGYDGVSVLSQTWYYRVATNSWTSRAAMSTPRFGHESTMLGGFLYVVAGDNDGVPPGLFSTDRYDPTTNTWAPFPAQHIDRVFGGGGVLPVIASPGQWYVTGGGFSSYGNLLATTERFDPTQGVWEVMPESYNLSVPRDFLGSAVRGNELYAVGGFNNGTPGTLGTNERLAVTIPTAVEVTGVTAGTPAGGVLVVAALVGAAALFALVRIRRRA